MKRYCFALDLKDDPNLIAEYEYWHKAENGWPEIRKSIINAGIINMEIWRTGNRLFMIMDVGDDYEPELKAEMDAANADVQRWETLMWKYQAPLPWAAEGEKWVRMQNIYDLNPPTKDNVLH